MGVGDIGVCGGDLHNPAIVSVGMAAKHAQFKL